MRVNDTRNVDAHFSQSDTNQLYTANSTQIKQTILAIPYFS